MSKKKGEAQEEIIVAQELAKQQKEISVSQFFERNRHLLGFDSPVKALATAVKEMVDNSLDACEEMHILPEVIVVIKETEQGRYLVSVEDNGPGIVKEQIPRVFAKLLYGSKFHRFKQGRGQQGIGVSASVLYGQLTTGKPSRISSRISPKKPAHYYELHIDITKNEPEIIVDKEIEWMNKDHGTKVEVEMEGKYQKGRLSVDEYVKQTAISNPHLNLVYINPLKEKVEFKRVTTELPKETKEIKPHPYGIELGVLIRMLKGTDSRNLRSFLSNEFSRLSSAVADEILTKANLSPDLKPQQIQHQDADKIFKAIQQAKIMAPPTDCLSPIGEELLLKGLKKEMPADFYAAVSRSPAVYRGNPFQIEVAIAYGGQLPGDELVRLIRFANKVPLIYQQSACAITKSVLGTDWKNYGLQQSKGALPSGPAVIVVHIASVWVPFTSESKEAIASYPDITKEMKLALQECGRKLNAYIRKNVRAKEAKERVSLFEKYIPEVADALADLTGEKKTELIVKLQKILKKGLPALMAEANGEQTNGKAKE